MVKDKYIQIVKTTIRPYSKKNGVRFFLFGSSIKRQKFGDLDLGVIGKIGEEEINELREKFKESDLPYFVDVIDFNKVGKDFKENVLDNDVLWIKP